MIVAGGVYREECLAPRWSRIFGSGGRAAVALSSLSDAVILHAYVGRAWAGDAEASFRGMGVDPRLRPIAADITFRYFHPMSVAELTGAPAAPEPPLDVRGAAVLRFGFVEGDALVRAGHCVFDPQNADYALRFRENGSQAERLAIVLNEGELYDSTALEGEAAIAALRKATGADVVVVKRGPRGAQVHAHGAMVTVPARVSSQVFKIGSGDVFSAVFAHHWAERGSSPADAAEAASRAVGRYAMTRDLAALEGAGDELPAAPTEGEGGPVYLAAPFFNLGQRWMVEEARDALMALGAPVFSPLHEVGTAGSSSAIATADLAGLRGCRSVLAIVDGEDAGTLFEVGYARDRDIPVVVLAENPRRETLTMLEGSGCRIARDLTTAVYHAVWAALT